MHIQSTPSTARAELEAGVASSIRRIGRRVVIDATRFDATLTGETPAPNARAEFLTVRQIAERHPAFTEAAIRQLIARAEKGRAVAPPRSG